LRHCFDSLTSFDAFLSEISRHMAARLYAHASTLAYVRSPILSPAAARHAAMLAAADIFDARCEVSRDINSSEVCVIEID
jgi:hypothetical protein